METLKGIWGRGQWKAIRRRQRYRKDLLYRLKEQLYLLLPVRERKGAEEQGRKGRRQEPPWNLFEKWKGRISNRRTCFFKKFWTDYILWDIFIENMTAFLPFIMTSFAVNMDKRIRWLERQVMPFLLMIEEIEKRTGVNYLKVISKQTRLTEKQEMKIKQMTTNITDVLIGWYCCYKKLFFGG